MLSLLRVRRHTLFVRLLAGFLLIIVLLLSFNLVSFAFFQNTIQDEIIDHNTLHLRNTVNNYEKQLELISSRVSSLYFSQEASSLIRAEGPDYVAMLDLRTAINALVADPLLYVDNVLVLFRDSPFVLYADGSTDTTSLFTKFYVHETYTSAFWQEQFAANYASRWFPAAMFHLNRFDQTVTNYGVLLPLVIKSKFNPQMLAVALVKAEPLFAAFHYNGTDPFYVMDGNGDMLYQAASSAGEDEAATEAAARQIFANRTASASSGYELVQDRYYFYETSERSRITYVSAVPNARIAAQVTKMNWLLFGLMIAVVTISLLLSVVLSMKVAHPVRHLIHLLQKARPSEAVRSSIQEFHLLQETIETMLHTQEATSEDLDHKNRLLQNYGYLSKLNHLYHWNELRDLIETTRPYELIVFQFRFPCTTGHDTGRQHEQEMHRWRESIHCHLGSTFPESVTLQTEKDRILTLLFDQPARSGVLDAIHRWIAAWQEEPSLPQTTIALHPSQHQPAELAAAYEETVSMLIQRRLVPGIQLITEQLAEQQPLTLSAADEQELTAAWNAASEERMTTLLRKWLEQLRAAQATAHQYNQWGKTVTTRLLRLLLEANIDIRTLFQGQSPSMLLQQCEQEDEFADTLLQIGQQAVHRLLEQRSTHDPITQFVIDYAAKHYGEDISLEQVADKLQLSRGYVSTYFHEKTGRTFTDYLLTVRMEQAKQLLAETDIRIQDVAQHVGYNNVNSFIRMFKRACGLTPGEFRRTVVQEQALM